DIELAAAGRALRIDLVACAGGGQSAAQVMLVGVDLAGHRVARTAGSRPVRISALHDKARFDAMESQAVVKALVHQRLEIRDRLGRDGGVKLDDYAAAIGLDDCVMTCVSHWESIRCAF